MRSWIDATTLTDTVQRLVPGIQDQPNIAARRRERFIERATTRTPLQRRICAALLNAPWYRMQYGKLAEELWPPAQHPRAWRYSSNGGPPGCYMALSRAIGQLQRDGLVGDIWEAPGRREIKLVFQ